MASRTTFQYYFHDFYTTQARFNALLKQRGYKYINENNEHVWKKGIGFLTAIKYVKIEYAPNNVVVLSGWVRMALDKERDLNGVTGVVPKRQVLKLLEELQAQIC